MFKKTVADRVCSCINCNEEVHPSETYYVGTCFADSRVEHVGFCRFCVEENRAEKVLDSIGLGSLSRLLTDFPKCEDVVEARSMAYAIRRLYSNESFSYDETRAPYSGLVRFATIHLSPVMSFEASFR